MAKYTQLSLFERYTISFFLIRKKTQAYIARELNRSPSTISRELNRNRAHCDNAYRVESSHSYAIARRKRVRRGSHFSPIQWDFIVRLIRMDFSPEQISNLLKQYGPFTISHETIYKYILKDKKNGGTLYKHLRIMPKLRRKRYNSHDSRGVLPGKKHISERPSTVETREDLGHWEGDTVVGRDLHHCILTLVERKSGYVIIQKLRSRTAAEVTKSALSVIHKHPGRFKTITFDNGTEFHGYKELEDKSPVLCYFATPYHSWERGTNENTNGLIRQYIPKKACMKNLTQIDCDIIMRTLNMRPRKRHQYRTPYEVFHETTLPLHFMLEFRRLLSKYEIYYYRTTY